MESTYSLSKKRASVLKEYYSRYLTEIRGLTQSSVKHYLDALNNISRRLREKDMIQQDIYEIMDTGELASIREFLNSDPDYIALNKRGNNMYSAGLNNYYRFAVAEGLGVEKDNVNKLDVPMKADLPVKVIQQTWKRSNILRTQAIAFADYKCELDKDHTSFISGHTHRPYMEGHHTIPMSNQGVFKNSLDVYANIVCLCPLCHRKIHFGIKEDRKVMAQRIYDHRAERLANSGINIDERDFLEVVLSGPDEFAPDVSISTI